MTKAGQRRIKQLDAQIKRGLARLDKWSRRVADLEARIKAQAKDIVNNENELNDLIITEQ